MPAITTRSLYGAVWVPGDGHLDPHTATFALAAAARTWAHASSPSIA